MQTENIRKMAEVGSEESFINLLKSSGDSEICTDNGRGNFVQYTIDVIIEGASQDEDETRKSKKIDLIAAFQTKEGIFWDKECTNAEEIAKACSEEGFVNLLKSHGDKYLNYIVVGAAKDEDETRKSMKMSLVAAYKAREGIFKVVEVVKADKKLLTKLAFNGASEKLVDLLKAWGNDPEAVHAIIEGAQMDRKKRFRWAMKKDKNRRCDKKDIVAEFYAKSGRFTPTETDTPDAEAQARIAELENRLAEMEKTVSKQPPEKPTVLKLQQP